MATSRILCKATFFAMEHQYSERWINSDDAFWEQHNMYAVPERPDLAALHLPLLGRHLDGNFAAVAVHRDDIAMMLLGCITPAQVPSFVRNVRSDPTYLVRSKHSLACFAGDFAGCKDRDMCVVVNGNKLSYQTALGHLWHSPLELLDSTKAALQHLRMPLSWLANFQHAGQLGHDAWQQAVQQGDIHHAVNPPVRDWRDELPASFIVELFQRTGLYEAKTVCKRWTHALQNDKCKLPVARYKRMEAAGFSTDDEGLAERIAATLLVTCDAPTLQEFFQKLENDHQLHAERITMKLLQQQVLAEENEDGEVETKLVECYKLLKERAERTFPLRFRNYVEILDNAIDMAACSGRLKVVRFWAESGYVHRARECMAIAASKDEKLLQYIIEKMTELKVPFEQMFMDSAVRRAARDNKHGSIEWLLSIGASPLQACIGAASTERPFLLRNMLYRLTDVGAANDADMRQRFHEAHGPQILAECVDKYHPMCRACASMMVDEMRVVPDITVLTSVVSRGDVEMFKKLHRVSVDGGLRIEQSTLTEWMRCTGRSDMMEHLIVLGADATALVYAPQTHGCTPVCFERIDKVFTADVSRMVSGTMWQEAMRSAILSSMSPRYVEWLLLKGCQAQYGFYITAHRKSCRTGSQQNFEKMREIMDILEYYSSGHNRDYIVNTYKPRYVDIQEQQDNGNEAD